MSARSRRALLIAVALAIFSTLARAQPPDSGTTDLIDIWNQIRHKPATAVATDDTSAMKAVAPVIGVKPSAGALFGVAGNVAFFAGDPRTTHISSVVASLTFSQSSRRRSRGGWRCRRRTTAGVSTATIGPSGRRRTPTGSARRRSWRPE